MSLRLFHKILDYDYDYIVTNDLDNITVASQATIVDYAFMAVSVAREKTRFHCPTLAEDKKSLEETLRKTVALENLIGEILVCELN